MEQKLRNSFPAIVCEPPLIIEAVGQMNPSHDRRQRSVGSVQILVPVGVKSAPPIRSRTIKRVLLAIAPNKTIYCHLVKQRSKLVWEKRVATFKKLFEGSR